MLFYVRLVISLMKFDNFYFSKQVFFNLYKYKNEQLFNTIIWEHSKWFKDMIKKLFKSIKLLFLIGLLAIVFEFSFSNSYVNRCKNV